MKNDKSVWLVKVNERQACCLALVFSSSRWEYSPWRLNWTATVLQFVSSVLFSTPMTFLFLFLNLISGLNEKQWLTNQHHRLLSHTAMCLMRYLPWTLFLSTHASSWRDKSLAQQQLWHWADGCFLVHLKEIKNKPIHILDQRK